MNKNFAMMFGFIYLTIFSILPAFATDSKTETVKQLLKEVHVDNVSESGDVERTEEENEETGELGEILQSLDECTKIYTKEEMNDRMNELNYKKSGIGILFRQTEDGFLEILDVYDGGAKDAGIKKGDVIVYIESSVVSDHPLNELIQMMSGLPGSFMNVIVFRESEGMIEKRIERKIVRFPSAYGRILSGNIGYIQILTFSEDLMKDVSKEMEKLKGVDGYIIDLRNNMGGYVDSAREFLGLFPTVKTSYLLDTNQDKKQKHKSVKQENQIKKRVSLLVNGYSASSSEIVAGAFRDYGVGKIYGQKTFGKGTMQAYFEIEHEGSLFEMISVTVARFYSPNGSKIDGIGIEPDVVTHPGDEFIRAHEDMMKEKLKEYKEIEGIRIERINEGILVKFPREFNLMKRSRKDFKLFQPGREDFEYKIKALTRNIIMIKVDSDFTGTMYVSPRVNVDKYGRFAPM